MNIRSTPRTAGTSFSSAENNAERRRMSFGDLFFLAAGGTIGSGWLLGGLQAQRGAGTWVLGSWLIGGALMLLIAAVMVKLSTAVPKTGGLVFLPLQSGGPLLATVVAAGLWLFYASNPASEASAMVRGLADWRGWNGLVIPNSSTDGLTWSGIGLAAVFMLLMASVNLLGPRRFLLINAYLTVFKILVPVLIIALLIYAEVRMPRRAPHFGPLPGSAHSGFIPMLSAVTGSGVIYAYIGFQGPLDFAGNVRRGGMGEAARLRWAVYGTVLGSVLLYLCLQFVALYIGRHSGGAGPRHGKTYPATFVGFADAVAPGWARGTVHRLISLDTVLSPAGAGMIFTYVLTREVAALSRAHLTHRGLQMSKYSVIPLAGRRLSKLFDDERLDVFWLILIVDLVVSGILLAFFGGRWSIFTALTASLAMVAYAPPSVVLASLHRRTPGLFPGRWHYLLDLLAASAFVAIAVIYFLTGWSLLWRSMAALALGCLALFGLPWAMEGSRWYDAKVHVRLFRELRTSPQAQSAVILFGYLAISMLASLLNQYAWPGHPAVKLLVAVPLAVLAWLAFRRMVTLSVRYMEEHPPTLPAAMPAPASRPEQMPRPATARSE